MSKGKKWKMPDRYLHKRLHPTFPSYYRVGGGKNGKYRFKFFRHKKRFKVLMEGKISMRKFRSMEIWYYD